MFEYTENWEEKINIMKKTKKHTKPKNKDFSSLFLESIKQIDNNLDSRKIQFKNTKESLRGYKRFKKQLLSLNQIDMMNKTLLSKYYKKIKVIEIIVKNNTNELKEIMKNELKNYIKSLKEESGSLKSEQEKKLKLISKIFRKKN